MKRAIFIGVVSAIFISRFLFFVITQDVGTEHDSGWYLGVARNLAERGIYASYTNTIATSEKPGAHPSIHGRFSVQDEDGFLYFPAGVTVGPGYIVPQALIFRLFGVGPWQMKAFPIIAFSILIPLLFFIVLEFGSLISLVLFQIWLWFYPQLFINLFHEAFAEHVALLYFLFAVLMIARKNKGLHIFFVSGLLFSLSYLTKSVMLVTGGGFVLFFLFQLIQKPKKTTLFAIIFFCFGVLIPVVLFEGYKATSLIAQFGKPGYDAILKDQELTMQCCGSGLNIENLKQNLTPLFINQKINSWLHIGMMAPLLLFPFLFALVLYYSLRITAVFQLLALSAATHLVWFVFVSPTGWFRHAWSGVVLFMISTSILFSFFPNKKTLRVLLLDVLIVFAFFIPVVVDGFGLPNFFLTRGLIRTIQLIPSPNERQGPLFTATFFLSDQIRASGYIQKKVSTSTRICYIPPLLVAELPVYANRVLFPISRCRPGDVLIVGPYQKGPSTLVNEEETKKIQDVLCDLLLFQNTSYTLCQLKQI